jgi:Domain of unknown function (DUF4202)
MNPSDLVHAATRWVVESYPYNSHHLMRALEWLDRLAPGSRTAVRLATLTHDMERAFPGPDQPVATTLDDPVYYTAHSNRSARIVGAWLRDQGAESEVIEDVEALIRVHEFGGWPEADLVQAADSLSFLETNIDLFLGFVRSGKYSAHDVNVKFEYAYNRIRVPQARELARPLLEQARERLSTQSKGSR